MSGVALLAFVLAVVGLVGAGLWLVGGIGLEHAPEAVPVALTAPVSLSVLLIAAGFLLFAVACLRTNTPSRRVGYLLFVPVIMWIWNYVALAIFGSTYPGTVSDYTVIAPTFLYLGYLFRTNHVPPDHASEGTCDPCGWRYPARAMFRCRVCTSMHSVRPSRRCVFFPAVIAFLYDRGVTTRWHAEDLDGLEHLGEHDPSYDLEIVSEDPHRVAVTVTLDGDDLRVTFDESVTVVDTSK